MNQTKLERFAEDKSYALYVKAWEKFNADSKKIVAYMDDKIDQAIAESKTATDSKIQRIYMALAKALITDRDLVACR